MFDYEGSRSEFLKILAELGEEPAFLKRARAHQSAMTALIRRCVMHREEQLKWPRRHFTALRQRIADDWGQLSCWVLNPDPHSVFTALAAELPVVESYAPGWLATRKSLLHKFADSVKRFNRSWLAFLDQAGLKAVNRTRQEYNQFYPMEKACAFGFDSINAGFEPLPMLDQTYLLGQFPLLPTLDVATTSR